MGSPFQAPLPLHAAQVWKGTNITTRIATKAMAISRRRRREGGKAVTPLVYVRSKEFALFCGGGGHP